MVLKFLGIGKKSEFFLEAPPADSQPAAKTDAATPAAPEPSHVDAKAVLAPVAEKISEATSKVSEATSKAKKTLKEVNVEKKAKAEKNGAAPTAPAAPAPKPEPTLTNFATTLQVNNTPRRRPGPSLNMFKDMAKQVNSRK